MTRAYQKPQARTVCVSLHPRCLPLLTTTIAIMTCLKLPKFSFAATAVLDGTVRSLEATKDTITAAAPVPGLSIALNVVIELLKKIQVRDRLRQSMVRTVRVEQGARSNCDALETLCQQATSLADTLEGLAKTITAGLTKYPVGSLQRRQARERVFGSGSKFHQRVEKLGECVRSWQLVVRMG